MKASIEVDVETKDQVKKILEEADLKPLLELGEKIWEVKGGEFEIRVPGGVIKYIPAHQ